MQDRRKLGTKGEKGGGMKREREEKRRARN